MIEKLKRVAYNLKMKRKQKKMQEHWDKAFESELYKPEKTRNHLWGLIREAPEVEVRESQEEIRAAVMYRRGRTVHYDVDFQLLLGQEPRMEVHR